MWTSNGTGTPASYTIAERLNSMVADEVAEWAGGANLHPSAPVVAGAS